MNRSETGFRFAESDHPIDFQTADFQNCFHQLGLVVGRHQIDPDLADLDSC